MATKKGTKKKRPKSRIAATTKKRTTKKTALAKGKRPRKRSPGKKAAKKRGVVAGAAGSKKESCFTIMPFGGYFDSYYQDIFRPAIKAAGLEPNRADDLYRPSAIVNDIWSYTKNAKVILADLTGKNPNVFYELAIRHASRLPVIHIIRKADKVPFDINQSRAIEIDNTDIYSLVPQLETFRSQLATFVRQALSGGASVNNPLTVFCPDLRVSLPT